MKKKLIFKIVKIPRIQRFFMWVVDCIQCWNLDGSQGVTLGEVLVRFDLSRNQTKGLPSELQKSLTKAISKHKKRMKTHFKKDGWDLDAGFIIDDVLEDALGFNLKANVRARLLQNTAINWKGRLDKFTKDSSK